ncbi:MAG: hypothetical protein GY810_14920 [Aureispira sp.]|nr:hypothetical protein [Aureispira sp.]
MKTVTFYMLLTLLILSLSQAACNSPAQHKLVGEWIGYTIFNGEDVQKGSTLVIEQDGHFTQFNEEGAKRREGFCVLDSNFVDLREEEDIRMRKRIIVDDINEVEVRLELVASDTLEAEQAGYTYIYVRQDILPE